MKFLFRRWWGGFKRWLRDPSVLFRSDSEKLQSTIRVRSWLPFLIFLVTLIWYLVDPAPIIMMTMIALGGLLLGAYLWSRSMARGVHGSRRLRFAAMQVGDELEEQIGLVNRTGVPVVWAEFLDRSNIPGYTVSSARAADAGGKTTWRAHTICMRRGVFTLGPWELRLGEPFGIFSINQLYREHQEILVYPPLATLPERVLPHRGALGDHRPMNQPLRAETISSTTVRAYSPGDPLRHIHWPTSARRGDPFVKVFAPEAASSIWLVPDFDSAAHLGEGAENSEETMVIVTASMAAALLKQNLSVGMFASADQETVVLPRQGQPHLWSILQAIAPLNAVPGRPLEETLTKARSLITGNDLLMIITPSISPDWVTSLRRIARSRGSGGRAEVVLIDPASFGPAEEVGSAEGFLPLLLEQGITANVLRREDVQVISGSYGEVSRWEFSVGGTGRVTTKRKPRAVEVMAANASVNTGGNASANASAYTSDEPWKVSEP